MQKDNPADTITVLITAAFPAMRAGLQALVESDPSIQVVAECASPVEWGPHIPQAQVLILAQLGPMPEEWGNLIRQKNTSSLPILLMLSRSLTEQPDLGSSAWGALSLTASSDEINAAIHALSRGLWVADPAFIQGILAKPIDPKNNPIPPLLEPLSKRELQTLQCLAEGFTNKEIAHQLGISPQTVKFHVASIYSKMGVNNRTEAVRAGVKQGLVIL